MYIPRSILLLFIFISLILVVGLEWINASGANWYRPFFLALAIILLSAWMQRHQNNDDY